MAAVIYVKSTKVSDFGTSEIFFYPFTKPFKEFELLHGAAKCSCLIRVLFSKNIRHSFVSTVNNVTPVS